MAAPVVEFGRNGGLEGKGFASNRMIKFQPPGVKHKATGLLGAFTRFSVDGIADKRGAFVV